MYFNECFGSSYVLCLALLLLNRYIIALVIFIYFRVAEFWLHFCDFGVEGEDIRNQGITCIIITWSNGKEIINYFF